LREVVGRTSDNFLLADGRVVHGEYFTHLFYGRDGVEQFQFEQHTPLRYTLRIVPAQRYRSEIARQLEREVRQMIGEQAELSIEVREEIPKTASGKYRFTISHVDAGQLVGSGGRR
jgi:phenylacetate-CoA ligase